MEQKGDKRMFTAERLSQIFLAIVMVVTALVIGLKKTAQRRADPLPVAENTTDTITTNIIDTLATDTAALVPAAKATTNPRKKKKNKKKNTTKAPVRQRDHMQEPMTVSEK